MNVDFKYYGKSQALEWSGGWSVSFAPNLARPKVFFDQELKDPIRFREAMSALHAVVVGDFRYQKKDRSAWLAWKQEEQKKEDAIRKAHHDKAYAAELQALAREPVSPTLEDDFRRYHEVYWRARRQWANELARNDPELFRALVPCDPIVTVAPDVVFFECFAKDESAYGCLYVDREAFLGKGESGLGTTNVDYSLALYDHFQSLRTYRPTRLKVDPTGFEVAVQGHEDYREEKIDLPSSWLRGFGQLQGALTLAPVKVELSVDAVYSMLRQLARRKERTGPRSLRFELEPGKAPRIVMEPWDLTVQSRGAPYAGDKPQTIKVWGRRRLGSLARVLPLCEKVEVLLLGSGMPSIWTAHLGDMRFVLALSGWTANDWTSTASLELLAGDLQHDDTVTARLESHLAEVKSATLGELVQSVGASKNLLRGGLHQLSQQGQVIYDFARERYRWRPVMPVKLSEAVVGQPPEEVREGKRLFAAGEVKLTREEALTAGRKLLQGKVKGMECEALVDLDGGFTKAKCGCGHFRRFRLRAGPCRHLLALRLFANRKLHEPQGFLGKFLN